MVHLLDYKPFSSFWQNCQLNNVFSVLVSEEPSYRYAAYLNDYCYEVLNAPAGNRSTANLLDFRYDDGIKRYIEDMLFQRKTIDNQLYDIWKDVLKFGHYYFKNENDFLEEVRNLLMDRQVVSVGVNLFYWIEGSISYQQYHYNHYALIVGFDDKKALYYTFDDDLFGYGLHSVPEERFRIAFLKSDLKTPPAYLIKVSKDIEPYELTLSSVLNCAQRLTRNISDLGKDDLWYIDATSEDFSEAVDKCIISANKVVNRHLANKLLFESMYELGLVRKKDIIDKFLEKENELIDGWIEVKNVIALCKFSGNGTSNIREIVGIDKALLESELSMWEDLIRVISWL